MTSPNLSTKKGEPGVREVNAALNQWSKLVAATTLDCVVVVVNPSASQHTD